MGKRGDTGQTVAEPIETIQCDFVGEFPSEEDRSAIRLHLNNLFSDFHIALDPVIDHVIANNKIGTVMLHEGESDEEGEDDEDSSMNVFSLNTVINLSGKEEFAGEIRSQLADKCQGREDGEAIAALLQSSDGTANVKAGLLVNEYHPSMARITLQPLASISNELRSSVEAGNSQHAFSHLVMLCQVCRVDTDGGDAKKRKKSAAACSGELVFLKPEEELIRQEATHCCMLEETSENAESGLAVLAFPADQLPSIMTKVKTRSNEAK